MITQSTEEKKAEMQDAMSEALMDVIGEFADHYQLSSLSALCCAFIALANAMRPIGGVAAKPYMQTAVDGAYAKTPKEAAHLTRRAMTYMDGMIAHYDALVQRGRMQ